MSITRSQAGQEVVCSCGVTLQVPTLRGINSLEPLNTAVSDRRADRANKWSLSRGLATSILMVVGALSLTASGFNARDFRNFPFDTSLTKEQFAASIDSQIQRMSPGEVLIQWDQLQRHGFREKHFPLELTLVRSAKRVKNKAIFFGVVGLVCIAGTVACAVWPVRPRAASVDTSSPRKQVT